MEVLVLLFVLAAFVVVPLLVLGALVKVAFAVVVLPFKLLGALFEGVFGLVGGVLGAFGALFGLAVGGIGLFLGLLITVAAVVILPLAPLILLGLVVWVALKLATPRSVPQPR